ncbi:inhibitor of growth protein 3 isoform X2 [Uranotaenia lowii]|uniref:inhibitor of growth protein 3 isoform X2 n=1 Tax=Uranotaenia lowii TaxID=190385 RepID=UPI002478468A|nr:inhibitor of growth protein 3 isoform X2 [Uranotaenia lowii]
MLYLEDYLEMIEHLPQELRDRFTEMREMDLSVQNQMDSLDKRVRTLFQQCRRGETVGPQADSEFHTIRKDYYRVLEDSDEKVQLAGQMYDLVDRYLRRLDSELYKFKCELEADHNGITEILEKRSLELDSSTSNGGLNQKENRYFDTLTALNSVTSSVVPAGAARVESRYKIKPEKRRENLNLSSHGGPPPEKRPSLASSLSTGSVSTRPTTPAVSSGPGYHHMLSSTAGSTTPNAAASVAYNLQQFGAGNAIAAAASQAIAQTQQMQQGRRTASLKASYEAIHGATGAGGAHDLLNALQEVARDANQLRRQHKKKLTTNPSAADLLDSSAVPGLLGSSGSSLTGSSTTSIGPSGSALMSGSMSSGSSSTLGLGPSLSSGSAGPLGPLTTSGPPPPSSLHHGPGLGPNAILTENGMVVEQTPEGEWTYDPNEPRYCICNQVSYGDMVACDNEDCPFEWFHYPCVNITSSPKGKWYCPQCSSSMKRRAPRKN